jgi:hypothetical protein
MKAASEIPVGGQTAVALSFMLQTRPVSLKTSRFEPEPFLSTGLKSGGAHRTETVQERRDEMAAPVLVEELKLERKTIWAPSLHP